MKTATPKKVRYGWILADAEGRACEPLTQHLRVPYYRSKEAAQKAADRINKRIKQERSK